MSDLYEVALDPSVPPGVYTLRVGLWDRMTGERMRVLDANSQPTDQDGVVLTEDFSVTNTP